MVQFLFGQFLKYPGNKNIRNCSFYLYQKYCPRSSHQSCNVGRYLDLQQYFALMIGKKIVIVLLLQISAELNWKSYERVGVFTAYKCLSSSLQIVKWIEISYDLLNLNMHFVRFLSAYLRQCQKRCQILSDTKISQKNQDNHTKLLFCGKFFSWNDRSQLKIYFFALQGKLILKVTFLLYNISVTFLTTDFS